MARNYVVGLDGEGAHELVDLEIGQQIEDLEGGSKWCG